MTFTVTGIVLAAGLGARFDPSGQRYKLTQQLPNQMPVINAACLALYPYVQNLLIVQGERAHELDQALANLPMPIQRIDCVNAAAGMGASLKAGVRASFTSDAWLIALADMPFIHDATLMAVRHQLRQGATLVRPFYHGQPGHPVGIAKSLRSELLQLADHAGAAQLIKRHPNDLVRIDVLDAGSIRDIDYPADLQM